MSVATAGGGAVSGARSATARAARTQDAVVEPRVAQVVLQLALAHAARRSEHRGGHACAWVARRACRGWSGTRSAPGAGSGESHRPSRTPWWGRWGSTSTGTRARPSRWTRAPSARREREAHSAIRAAHSAACSLQRAASCELRAARHRTCRTLFFCHAMLTSSQSGAPPCASSCLPSGEKHSDTNSRDAMSGSVRRCTGLDPARSRPPAWPCTARGQRRGCRAVLRTPGKTSRAR